MDAKENSLRSLELTAPERAALPLGYSAILVKSISPRKAERAVTVYSEKFKKSDMYALAATKPLSKIGQR